jgi:hypothetical protein
MFGCSRKKPTKKALLSQKTGTKGFGSAVPPKLATEVAHLFSTEIREISILFFFNGEVHG